MEAIQEHRERREEEDGLHSYSLATLEEHCRRGPAEHLSTLVRFALYVTFEAVFWLHCFCDYKWLLFMVYLILTAQICTHPEP